MKKLGLLLLVFFLASCVQQKINTDSTYIKQHSFDEVWNASIKAVNDIDFTVDSVDKDAGFIAAESGRHVLQEAPPRLSIMIKDWGDAVSVDCKLLQKDQIVDLFSIGKKIVRRFMVALNMNLNR